jgi:hypothetical protein
VKIQELETDVQSTANIVAEVGASVPPNEAHRVQLRATLLRRQQELLHQRVHARSGWPLARLRRVKRRLLLAPPALAIATVLSVVLWSLQIAGHQPAQSAEAARLDQALARSVPLITGWSVVLREQSADSSSTIVCQQHDQRLFLRGDRSYLFRNNRWYELTRNANGTVSAPGCSFDLQWAFFFLPEQLTASHGFSILSSPRRGAALEVVQYTSRRPDNATVKVTAWVEKTTGLVAHLNQVVSKGTTVLERDSAEYRYTSGR